MVATLWRCALVEALVFEHFHHAEHAVHRRADFVAHGGEEGGLGLVGGFRLGASRGFRALLAASASAASRSLQFRDVVIDAEQAAVLERRKMNSM